jgi:hypothetical protein
MFSWHLQRRLFYFTFLGACKSIWTRQVLGTVYLRAFSPIRLKYKIMRAMISVGTEFVQNKGIVLTGILI